jgi:alginate O-acetyltransferase complex protein AlgI
MLFMQIEFLALLGVAALFMLLDRRNRHRKLFLLAASYYFYAYWDWRFLGLILASTVCDYLVGLGLARARQPMRRRLLLMTSLVCNLGILGFFKYYNFFIDSLNVVLAPMGFHTQTLDIILPVGISFYTFQTLSYSIDVYRGRIATCRDFCDFALFVGFFPQLVSGPIVRAADFLPQLAERRHLTWERAYLGGRSGSSRRSSSPIAWPCSSMRFSQTPARTMRSLPGWRCSLTPCRSIVISPVTRIWRSGRRVFSVTT